MAFLERYFEASKTQCTMACISKQKYQHERFFFYLRAEIFVFMVVPFNEVAVLPGGDHALSLDAMTTWTPRNVTTHVSIYFGGYIGHRFSSVFTILQKKMSIQHSIEMKYSNCYFIKITKLKI